MFGVDTELGFKLKRFRDIQTSLQAKLIQITDPDTGETLQVDFDEDDPFIQSINALIAELAEAWEELLAAYNQFDPTLSAGPALTGLVQLNGITRKQGTPSTIPIDVTGGLFLIIPAGQEITDINNEVVWLTDNEIVLDGSGNGTGTASSKDSGAFVAATGTVNKIQTPLSGWNSVENSADSTLGTADETDEDLRRRRRTSTLTPAQSIAESIYSNVLNIEGVDYSRLYVNNTQAVDSRGIPAKSVAQVVVGGDDDEIARVLFERVGVGVGTYGTTTKNITDLMGEVNAVSFIRPTEIQIDVEVDVTVIDASVWSGTLSPDEIVEAIIIYAEEGATGLGINTDVAGFDDFGFPPGEDVIISRLYTPINSVPGHKINSVEIAYNGDPLGVLDLAIDWDEVSKFITANISVVVT